MTNLLTKENAITLANLFQLNLGIKSEYSIKNFSLTSKPITCSLPDLLKLYNDRISNGISLYYTYFGILQASEEIVIDTLDTLSLLKLTKTVLANTDYLLKIIALSTPVTITPTLKGSFIGYEVFARNLSSL